MITQPDSPFHYPSLHSEVPNFKNNYLVRSASPFRNTNFYVSTPERGIPRLGEEPGDPLLHKRELPKAIQDLPLEETDEHLPFNQQTFKPTSHFGLSEPTFGEPAMPSLPSQYGTEIPPRNYFQETIPLEVNPPHSGPTAEAGG